jgi:hypothetical protein
MAETKPFTQYIFKSTDPTFVDEVAKFVKDTESPSVSYSLRILIKEALVARGYFKPKKSARK